MGGNHYVFDTVWRIPANPSTVFSTLADLSSYPRWWPEVRSATEVEGGYHTVCRSFLPYELRFDTLQGRVDQSAGVIEGRLRGHLDGVAIWTLDSDGDGTRAVYHQDVLLQRRSLNAIGPIARPFFRANHTLMMRHGHKGLVRYLT